MARVLVVEDDSDIRYLILHHLRGVGHEVAEAEDGQAGLALAAEFRPEAIVTDLAMPLVSGTDLIHTIRARDDELATRPIVVFTGLSTTHPDVHALADVADVCVLHKPMELRIVGDVVAQMVLEQTLLAAPPRGGAESAG